MTIRSSHAYLAARTFPCTLQVAGVHCPTGPSMLVHNDMQGLGKGMGHKSVDIGAAGCDGCHNALRDLPREEAQWYTMRGTIRTIELCMDRGWMKWTVTLANLRRDACSF